MRVDAGSGGLPRKLIAMATGLASLYLVIVTGQRALDAYRANQEVEAVRLEIAALRARNVELQNQLASNRLDEVTERIAREELGLARPGDQPVVLVWPNGVRPRDPAPPPEPVQEEPNWRQWLSLFVDPPPTRR